MIAGFSLDENHYGALPIGGENQDEPKALNTDRITMISDPAVRGGTAREITMHAAEIARTTEEVQPMLPPENRFTCDVRH